MAASVEHFESTGPREEAPPWLAIAGMFVVVALIATALISLCLLAASLAT